MSCESATKMLEPSSSDDEDAADVRPAVHKRQASREGDFLLNSQPKVESVPTSSAHVLTSNLSAPPAPLVSNRTASPDASSQGSAACSSVPGDLLVPSGRSSARPVSPSPSAGSDSRDSDRGKTAGEEGGDRAEREEGERKNRLQLYVFVIRCISYPFNAKQPTDITRRPWKVQVSQFEQIQARFQAFVKGEVSPFTADEEFQASVQTYLHVFLESDRLQSLVRGGGVSLHDLRETFRQEIKKRIKSLPDPEGSTKEVILTSWMAKFEYLLRGEEESKKPSSRYQQQQQANLTAEAILTKDQLYEMFQAVLGIKKFEHQLLFK